MFLALLSLAAPAAAVFPAYLNYQGKLGDPSGNPQTGIWSFRFKLFAQSTGGSALFSEDVTGAGNALNVTNGAYSVQIGSYTAGGIPVSAFSGSETWLEIDVKQGTSLTGAETLSPRERLTSTPFSFRALTAEGLGVGVNVATFTAAGSLKARQFADTVNAVGNSGASQTIDWSLGSVVTVTMTAGCTFTYSNAVAGQTLTFILTQGGTGSYAVTWPTTKWPAATAPTLTTTVGKADIISVFYDGTSYWGFIGGQNY